MDPEGIRLSEISQGRQILYDFYFTYKKQKLPSRSPPKTNSQIQRIDWWTLEVGQERAGKMDEGVKRYKLLVLK